MKATGMMMISDPVGLPGLAAMAFGFFMFMAALFGARMRARSDADDTGGKRDNRSVLGIVLQGVAIGIVAFGPIRTILDPLSVAALATGAIVLLLMLCVAGLFHWSSVAMGRNWALVARTRGDASLVTNGPFAYVRNPIYVALALFMVAVAIAYGHSRLLVIALPLYALATWMRVALEEKVLRAQFGTEYDAYASRVKRFLPGLI